MKNKNPECSCLSRPQYHREDCPFYDNSGNLKSGNIKLTFAINDIDLVLSNGLKKGVVNQVIVDKRSEIENTEYLAKFLKHNFSNNKNHILIANNHHSDILNIHDLNVAVNKDLKNRFHIHADDLVWKNLNVSHILNAIEETLKTMDIIIFVGLESEQSNNHYIYKSRDFLNFLQSHCYNKYLLFIIDNQYYGKFFALDQLSENILDLKSSYNLMYKQNTWDIEILKNADFIRVKKFHNIIL